MSHSTHSQPRYVYPRDEQPLQRGDRALCIDCDETLIAKAGDINRWHWAHEAKASTCAGDGEGAWHKAWKFWAKRQGAEIEVHEGRHRADAVWPDGSVWEFQSAYLSTVDIAAREAHYGDRLTWIYRMPPRRFDRLWNIGGGWFRWDRPAPSMTRHQRQLIWHINDRLYDTTVAFVGEDVHVRFARGERDRYGEVLYGSRPAPFDLNEAVEALRVFDHPNFHDPRGVA